MSSVGELVEWLNACYDRAEQRARAAAPGPWKVARANGGSAIVDDAQDLHVIPPDIDYGPCVDLADCEHIADHDPQWRLADIARKRKILAEHEPEDLGVRKVCSVCADPPQYDASWREWPCRTVRLLAEEFASEPAYREEEWRP